MGKPWALRLLRSCLFFSGRRNGTEETIHQVNLEGEDDDDDIIINDGDDGVSVSQLPEDIIFDVLARLPVKTLCRFRCVSKGWRALISAQQSRASAPIVVGVFGEPRPREKFYPPQPPRIPQESLELRVIDTADGAVLRVVEDVKSAKLMRTRLGLVFVDGGERGVRVIDPATGQVLTFETRELPDRYPTANYNRTSNIPGIGFRSSCHCSFGRATSSGTYKVLRLYDTMLVNRADIQICHVATLRDDGMTAEPIMWRQRPEPPILTCHCSDCTTVVDGVLHFMDRGQFPVRGTTHGKRPGSPGWNRIASFDLESEEWRVIDGPPVTECPKEEIWHMVLAEFKGNLSVVQTVRFRYYQQGRDPYTNIWLLVDPEKSIWVKKYTIHMTKSWCYFKALDVLGDGRVLMLNSFKKDGDEALLDSHCILQFYNPSTGALTDLMEMGKIFRGPMTLYTGSLL